MNKSFIYGICAAFITFVLLKVGGSLLDKKPTVENEEIVLSLIDIGFLENTSSKPMPTHIITKHDGDQKETFTLGDLKGKPVILHFWATWCQPCKAELPFYNKFIAQHPEIKHVALTPDGTKSDAIKQFLSTNNHTNVPVMTDDKGAVAKYFGVQGFPSTLFINKEGQLVGLIAGIVDWKDSKTTELLLKTFAQ